MIQRNARHSTRTQAALVHRGPQALNAAAHASPHAPNAALLIDFDNVTMGIRSDLGKELRSLLSSEIIRGKVAVQRAYADWRRYPQYIVPLSESSIDLIFAPAYGSSKKNATDIRLAIDALELVFTRPEIGTFILLSGDSDFSSLVIKLKEYGKYVIGVGIRESSSDLLVQNCDEYYSYNALAGLVKASDEETVRKWDPWELVREAVSRMKSNGDVMRSDRLKQVMQEIDASFDEKNLNMSKFSRFVQEAANRGLLSFTKLDNGQLEIDLGKAAPAESQAPAPRTAEDSAGSSDDAARRGRRRGRGRDRERDVRRPAVSETAAPPPAEPQPEPEAPIVVDAVDAASTTRSDASVAEGRPASRARPVAPPVAAEPAAALVGDRLTRAEAFDLVRRALASLSPGEGSVDATSLRERSLELHGGDSESLSERMFVRILKDAHDAGIVDLRRRGNDFHVASAAAADPLADQAARAETAAVRALGGSDQQTAASAAAPRVGMRHRGAGPRGKMSAPPPELLAIGVVQSSRARPVEEPPPAAAEKPKKGGVRKAAAKKRAPAATATDSASTAPAARAAKRPSTKKKQSRTAKAASGS